jgi:N-acetylmuramoyl-L-alanine amidase
LRKRWILVASIALVLAAAGGIFAVYRSMTATSNAPQAYSELNTQPPLQAASPNESGTPMDSLVTPVNGIDQSGEVAPSETPIETASLTPSPTPEPTLEPTATPTSTPLPTPTPTPTPLPTPSPTPTPLPLEGLKIGIDPGHQLHADTGLEPVSPGSKDKKPKVAAGTSGRYTGTPEHEVNLTISLQLRDALIAQGAEVKMTRETADVDVSNVERAKMMNEWGADVVLRLHCDGATDSSANGIGLYVKPKGDGAEQSISYAKIILGYMVEATGAKENGVFQRDIYSGLNWSTVPSILVEMGYLTNKKEDKLLNDPDYQKKMVDGMVEGVAACFDRTLSAQNGAEADMAPSDPLGDSSGE